MDRPLPALSTAHLRQSFEEWRERYGRKALAVLATAILEVALIALLLSLGRSNVTPQGPQGAITSFDVTAAPPEQEQEPAKAQEENRDEPRKITVPIPLPPPPAAVIARNNAAPTPRPTQAVIVPLSRDELVTADIANIAPAGRPAPKAPAYGPAFAAASPNDTAIVGTAPDGSPLYAARWYREPSHGELTGYLATASGPGWALIACKTAPQWRVENCVGLGESPQGSNMLRAVLAAAWQFQVRPPRKGNDTLVGSWVRIRIEATAG